MEKIRSYRRRGAPDFPVALYLSNAENISHFGNPEYHPEQEIVLVKEGVVVLQLDDAVKTFRAGDIFSIPGNAVHCYRTSSEDAITFSLVFDTKAITVHPDHFFQKAFTQPLQEGRLRLPPLLQPGHPAYDGVLARFQQLENIRIYEKEYKLRRFSVLIGLCAELAPYCGEVARNLPEPRQGNEAVRLCMRYINNNYAKKLTLDKLAEVCHLHPNYLCALFKEYTGRTVFEYLIRFRVETAAELLKTGDFPAGKVGEMVGFRSESLFYRQFKAVMGITPKAYSKQFSGSK